jgi:hypothetical protein
MFLWVEFSGFVEEMAPDSSHLYSYSRGPCAVFCRELGLRFPLLESPRPGTNILPAAMYTDPTVRFELACKRRDSYSSSCAVLV